jgi:DNA-binding FadR family transcriptional regulator
MEGAAHTGRRRTGAHHEHVANELRTAISDERFGPGARLPSERRLAQSFGVSRATIVSALNVLRGEGLIESRRGAGSWVRQHP